MNGVHLHISDWQDAPATLPPGTEVFAIGDVHGQLDLLNALIDWVDRAADRSDSAMLHLVMLGDYIDRGPDSIGALGRIARLDLPGIAVSRLLGNHDVYLDAFLHDPDCGMELISSWIRNGGNTTLAELGVDIEDFYRFGVATVSAKARNKIDPSSAAILGRLKLAMRIGDYVFAHAGVHPHTPFDINARRELTLIREPFLSGEGWQHAFVVVHGHTPCGPDVRPHRIGVDSGAFYTGVLTCVQLRERQLRFIAASGRDSLEGFTSHTWRSTSTMATRFKP